MVDDAVLADFGTVDILINNAGITRTTFNAYV
jgi:NAD(P)-dependent dehydrogenase (short-subunit alcohol dehydrogenase family)